MKRIIDSQRQLGAASVAIGMFLGVADIWIDLIRIETSHLFTLYIALSAVLAASFAASTTAFAILFALGRGRQVDAVLQKFGHDLVRDMGADLAAVFGASVGCITSALILAAGAPALATGAIWLFGASGVFATMHFGVTLSQVLLVAMTDLQLVSGDPTRDAADASTSLAS